MVVSDKKGCLCSRIIRRDKVCNPYKVRYSKGLVYWWLNVIRMVVKTELKIL